MEFVEKFLVIHITTNPAFGGIDPSSVMGGGQLQCSGDKIKSIFCIGQVIV